MLNHPDADKALELVNEGVLTGVSIEAIPLKSVRENGVMRRVKARLVNIALCRSPAYPGAEVLAVRERQPEEEPMKPEDEQAEPETSRGRARRAGRSRAGADGGRRGARRASATSRWSPAPSPRSPGTARRPASRTRSTSAPA